MRLIVWAHGFGQTDTELLMTTHIKPKASAMAMVPFVSVDHMLDLVNKAKCCVVK